MFKQRVPSTDNGVSFEYTSRALVRYIQFEQGTKFAEIKSSMIKKSKNSFFAMILLFSHVATAQRLIPWDIGNSACQDCGIAFKLVAETSPRSEMDFKEKAMRFSLSLSLDTQNLVLWHDADALARTQIFLKTLSTEKAHILKLYSSNSQEYNILAHIAVGILGQESRFFGHWRYFIKRNSQLVIKEMKSVKAWINDKEPVANSKGPTQIKDVPERIARYYNITEKNLWDPKFAAVSTMGFLIEALIELKQRAVNNHLEFITPDTYVDYLPYIYFGGVKKLLDRSATPEKNIYVKNMKKNMKKVAVFEIVK